MQSFIMATFFFLRKHIEVDVIDIVIAVLAKKKANRVLIDLPVIMALE